MEKIKLLTKINENEMNYNSGIKKIVKIINSIGIISDSKPHLKYSNLEDSVSDYKSYNTLIKEHKKEPLLKDIKARVESTNEGAI